MSNRYDGQEINPTPDNPWTVVISHYDSYRLYGETFLKGKAVGISSSSGFSQFPKSNIAIGAYIIDTSSIIETTVDMLDENGPVLDITLQPLTIRPLISEITFRSMTEAIEYSHTLQTMTAVSPDIYAQIYRVIGARIGRWNGNEVDWEKPKAYPESKMIN